MKLYTTVDIPVSQYQITYKKQGMWLGSCFADRMGGIMSEFKFPVTVNPFGVLYNPASIVQSLLMMENKRVPKSDDLISRDGLLCSLDFHTSFSGINEQEVLHHMEDAVKQGNEALFSSDYLVLTLGTPLVYRYLPTGKIVCNCNKIPARQFVQERLDIDEIVSLFSNLFEREPYSQKQILFTVSPVRYIRNGLADNFLNKSILRVAVAELARIYPFVNYFPAYEIMTEELRDYRFYEEDMVHPSSQSVQYIWERFSDTYFSSETRLLFPELERITRAVRHRPLYPDSEAYHAFRETMYRQIKEISEMYPFLNLTKELCFFSSEKKMEMK